MKITTAIKALERISDLLLDNEKALKKGDKKLKAVSARAYFPLRWSGPCIADDGSTQEGTDGYLGKEVKNPSIIYVTVFERRDDYEPIAIYKISLRKVVNDLIDNQDDNRAMTSVRDNFLRLAATLDEQIKKNDGKK